MQFMIDREHKWYDFVDNLYEEVSVLRSVTRIHEQYLEEKSPILDVKIDVIPQQIQSLEKDFAFVSAVLREVIHNRLNKGTTIVESENLQSFGFYIKDLHIVIDSIRNDINYMHNRLEAFNLSKERKEEKKRYKKEIGIAITALVISVAINVVVMAFEILSYNK